MSPRLLLLFAAFLTTSAGAEPLALTADFAKPRGAIRALHGINKGPLAPGGLLDLTEAQRALGTPSIRLHDCHWPYPDVVDMHVVFPDLRADPERAESYDFTRTDAYVAAVKRTGAAIVYRLGESIEHEEPRRFVHPPTSAERWAAACLGIIRHYNEGWAGGARHGIRYWEIWNEPENRPAMWSGTDEQYFELYRTTARAVKGRWPDLKIGGPSVGNPGTLVKGELQPTEFVTRFLEMCRRDSVPLDFFSWHCYTADPHELLLRARGIRRLLDAHGFTGTESHLNEWNYLPANSWAGVSRKATPALRQAFADEMAGSHGAAFIAAALIELQDAPVDTCNLFHGEAGVFGIFNEHGVPLKNYHAVRAFHALAGGKVRVETRGGVVGQLAIAAALDSEHRVATILISNLAYVSSDLRLSLAGLPPVRTTEVRTLDAQRDFTPADRSPITDADGTIILKLPAPAVAWIKLHWE